MDTRWFKIFRTLFVLNFKEFLRDGVPLFFSIIMPSFFLVVFGIVQRTGGHGATGPGPDVAQYYRFMVPALLALGMANLCIFGTATPLVAAKDKGILKQYMLIPMPLSAMMISHVCVRLVVSVVQAVILLAIAGFAFGLTVEGNGFLLAVVYAICATALITFGYALAGVLNSMSLAGVVFMLLNFYVLAFGQIFTDMRSIPFAKWLIYTTPVAFASDALREAMLGQAGNLPIWTNIGVLGLWVLAAYWMGIRRFSFLPQAA